MSLSSLVNDFLPGSFPPFIFALTIGVALLYARDPLRQWARFWLTLVTVFYLVFSTQVGSSAAAALLNQHNGFLTEADAARGATAVVVLTPNPETYRARGQEISQVYEEIGVMRVLEAARVYRLLGNPWLILSGGFPDVVDRPSAGDVAKAALVRLGVPENRIVIEPLSRTTHEHPERLKAILQTHDIHRFVLVTSPEHMWRASAVFRSAGYDFVPSASRAASELRPPESRVWPKFLHLRETEDTSHEYLGLLYYWFHGWL